MKNSEAKLTSSIMAKAARLLIEGDMANPAEGRFSRVVFAVDDGRDERLTQCLFDAAIDGAHGAVLLRKGTGSAMPNRASVAFVDNGERIEQRNCVLWSEQDGAVLIVPLEAGRDLHFAVGEKGLERRPGRPAALLGQGLTRAKRRLEKAAHQIRLRPTGPHLVIAEDAAIAFLVDADIV